MPRGDSGSRAQRVARSVQEVLAELLPRVRDPRVAGAGLVTITHVRVSDDLSVARVQVALYRRGERPEDARDNAADEAAQQALLKGLASAAPFLQSELGRRLQAKKVPALRFHLDETGDRAARVDALLREIADEKKA